MVRLDASASRGGSSGRIVKYLWSFGDGTFATGRLVRHAFADAEGTLWDHSGRFRVLLTVTDVSGSSSSTYRPLVVSKLFHLARPVGVTTRGLTYKIYDASAGDLSSLANKTASSTGNVSDFDFPSVSSQTSYVLELQGYIEIPRDGGYTFLMKAANRSKVEIDSVAVVSSRPPQRLVCGSPGNAVQPSMGSIGLKAGKHVIRVWMTHTPAPSSFALLWQGPGVPLSAVPAQALSH
jgi:hypothetical protein